MIRKVTSLSLFIAFTLFTKIVSAQEDLDKPRFTITDINLGFGGYSYTGLGLSLNDFKKLAPESELLKADLSNLYTNGFYTNTYFEDALESQSVSEITVGVSKKISESKKYQFFPEFRFGFAHHSGIRSSRYYSREDYERFDTLTSSQTGQVFYVDSVKYTSYNMRYSAQQLRITASVIFRHNPLSRWSLYAGGGFNFGMTLNPFTEIDYTYRASTNFTLPYSVLPGKNEIYISETFRNKLSMAAAGFLIAGVDWRTGKKRKFWKRLHLSYELRPIVDYNNIPERKSFVNAAIQHQFSFRYTFNYL